MFKSILLGLVCLSGVLSQESINKQCNELATKLQSQENIVAKQQDDINNMQLTIATQDSLLQEQRLTLRELYETVDKQGTHVAYLKDLIEKQGSTFETRFNAIEEAVPGLMVYEASGCVGSTISMSCPSGYALDISAAQYGKWAAECSTCCPTDAADCREDVSSTNSNEWTALLDTCDKRGSCGYLYSGTAMSTCQSGYTADYMTVSYTCIEAVAAFSAYKDGVSGCNAYSKLVFDQTYSNIGGHYDTSTGDFTCPVSGYYYFSVTAGQDQNNNIAMQFVMDDQYYTAAFADYRNWDQGATSIVLNCAQGSKVWLRQGMDENSEYGSTAQGAVTNVFSGFLLFKQ